MESLWINISVCHFVHSHELLYWIINAELHPKFSGSAINKYFDDIVMQPSGLYDWILRFLNYFPLNPFNMT